jgi:light-regulated signal transduction histidine kinase (bacteriophytochrome)
MTDTFLATASCTANLIAMVRSSLETVRKMLVGGRQSEETNAQVRQLELLEQLLLDQDARLESINRVLEEFNYSVAHELCAPLRRISGFTREIIMRCASELEPDGVDCLNQILESSQQMNELIDALMQISRLSHVDLQRGPVNLTSMVGEIADELCQSTPERAAVFAIQPQVIAIGDASLLRTALCKLIGNAWKYTLREAPAIIEFGAQERAEERAFFIRDNGVGFDMSDSARLFHPFQRLHDPKEFSGNGIGLTAVKKIIDRHCGRVWAEGVRQKGATFYFTLSR